MILSENLITSLLIALSIKIPIKIKNKENKNIAIIFFFGKNNRI